MTFANVYQDLKPKKINKKMYRSAMRSIWSLLAEEGRLIILDDLKIEEPVKSSQVKTLLSDLGLNSALFVVASNEKNFVKASKNLAECKVQTINSLNPSSLLQATNVVLTSETLDKLSEVLL